MSVISGMDEVIAYIKKQDEKIKNLETNEKVRELKIVEMKDGIQNIIDVKDTEIANLKRRKPDYYELRSEIAELKKEKEEQNRLLQFQITRYKKMNGKFKHRYNMFAKKDTQYAAIVRQEEENEELKEINQNQKKMLQNQEEMLQNEKQINENYKQLFSQQDEEIVELKKEKEEQEKFRIGADLPEGCYR